MRSSYARHNVELRRSVLALYRYQISSPVVSVDALGLGVRDVLVAVGMMVPEGTGAAVTTAICTSTHCEERVTTGKRLSYCLVCTYTHIVNDTMSRIEFMHECMVDAVFPHLHLQY